MKSLINVIKIVTLVMTVTIGIAQSAFACREINVATNEALVSALQNTEVCDRINVAEGVYDLSELSPYSPIELADQVKILGETTTDTTIMNLPIAIHGYRIKLSDITISNFFRQDVSFVVSESKFKSVHFKGNFSGIWGSRWKIEGDSNKVINSEVSDMKLEIIGNKNILRRTVIHPWLDRSGTLLPLIITGDRNLVRNVTIVANAPIARGIWIAGSRNVIVNTIVQSVSTTDQGNAVYIQSGTRNKMDYSLIHFSGAQEILAEAGAEIRVGNNIVRGDPLFANPDGSDFHLQAGSPAIDAGVPNQLDPDGTRSDVGAFYFPQ